MSENKVVPAMSDDRYRLLVESVTDYAIYMLDPTGIIASWNPGAQRFKGYQPAEVIGSHFSRFFTPEDLAAGMPGLILETAAREGRYESEGWRVRRDGAHFWAHVVVDAIRGQDGALIGFAKITRDLSERRAADLALRESEERFRRLVQSVTDYAIYMLDADGMVSNWNAGARKIKQYTAEEIVGRHFSTFYTEEDRRNGEPARALATARSEGRFEKEGWRVRKDGSRFWANVIIDPVYGDDGAVVGFAKVTRDITERLEAQRSLEATREAFFQAQKVEAIGMLTGGIAHDFNNLLAVVLGSLELLRKRIDDPASLQLIDNAAQGATRGVSLTQRMLAFARRQDLKVEPVDVSALVVDIADLLRGTLVPGMNLDFDFPQRLLPVLTDANQLELAILNLVVNARDAMPRGGRITIAARLGTVAAPASPGHDALVPGDYIRLSVTDTGEGMDEATLKSASDPFFTTKGVGKGTGLGLPMVKGLAEQLGGRMTLASEVGKGTTVELWLPVADQPAAEKGWVAAEPVKAAGALRILAVDDDALILMNTVAMLEDLGHAAWEAMSGPDALAVLATQPVDLIITDHAMPGMTGAQFAAAVRSRNLATPIILATGYAELPAGTDPGLQRLAKPFSQTDLTRAIAKAMSHPAA